MSVLGFVALLVALMLAAIGLGIAVRSGDRYRSRWMLVVFCATVLATLALGDFATAAEVRIPEASVQYRLKLERACSARFGLNAPIARVAGQLHAESRWQPAAQSRFADGLAQFTPATAKWLPTICPDIGAFDPWNADQSIDAMCCYDAWLHQRVRGATECDRWAFTLSAYNGGLTWVQRDKQRASASGADPLRWFGHVAAHSARAGWAFAENRGYVERILLRYEHAYIAAGWPGEAVCDD